MKKIKVIVAAILRGVVILAPGASFAWWAWGKVPALFSILASVGLEALYLFIFAFMVVALKAAKDVMKKKKEAAAE